MNYFKRMRKGLAAFIAALAVMSGAAVNARAAEPWREAYAVFLRDCDNYMNNVSDKSGSFYFALHDMDNNGIPELLISYDADYASAYGAAFTFTGTAVTELGRVGGGSERYEISGNPDFPGLFASNRHTGGAWQYYYTVKNNALEEATVYNGDVDDLESGVLKPAPAFSDVGDRTELLFDELNEANILLLIYGLADPAVAAAPDANGTIPHPYATALRTFFKDAPGFTSAMLIDLNEDGTEEVYAVKEFEDRGITTARYALFYFDNTGKLNIDCQEVTDTLFWVTDKNYLKTFNTQGVELFLFDRGSGVRSVFSIHNKDIGLVPEARAMYGINTYKISLYNAHDETAKIMTMTVNDAPAVPAAVTAHPYAAALDTFLDARGRQETAILADLDNDGAEEMITFRIFMYKTGDGEDVTEISVYDVENGEITVEKLEGYNASGNWEVYISAANRIIAPSSIELIWGYSVYGYKDGKLTKDNIGYVYDYPTGGSDYFFNKTQITEREYQEYCETVGIDKPQRMIFNLQGGNNLFDIDNGVNAAANDIAGILAMTEGNTPTAQSNPPAVQSSPVNVTVDGIPLYFAEQPPVVTEGQTLVPIGSIYRALGYEMSWNPDLRQATLSKNDDTIVVTIDSAVFTVNGASRPLDVPAQLIGGKTMIPLSAVLESVDNVWEWNESSRTVNFITQ